MTRVDRCRISGSDDLQVFLDLGVTPLADALVHPTALEQAEATFPLQVAFCPESKLVQITEEVPAQQLFVDNYLYFSSYSDDLLAHSRRHALGLVEQRRLDADSLVVEIASNDGYLLRNFVDLGVPVLGIDPAPGQAAEANRIGVPTLTEFFGLELAERLVDEGHRADVIIANNVMAHVPDLNGFVAGMAHLLADGGVITVENPYVRDLIDHTEFDTIYHEHFCYYSCSSVDHLVRRHGLFLNHVEYFPELHGGTLRWYIGKQEEPSEQVLRFLADERDAGVDQFSYYEAFAARVATAQRELLDLLRGLRSEGASIAGYGAAAKGATLLNATGIGTDLVEYVVDRNPHKQGLCMPGTHQPIRAPESLLEDRPDFVLLLAWNFASEIVAQQADYLSSGGRFIVPVPHPQILS